MDITVEGQPHSTDVSQDDTLSTIIQRLDEQLQEHGYRVSSFELDGQEAWPEWEQQVGDKPANEFDELDVKVVSPHQHCQETLEELQSQFKDLLEHAEEATKLLGEENLEEGFKYLQSVLSHLQEYIDTINYIVLVSEIDLNEIELEDTPLNELAHDLRRIVNDVEGSIKDEELKVLSEISGNRLQPLIQKFISACPLIVERIQAEWSEPAELDELV